jgi:hypothetical protein
VISGIIFGLYRYYRFVRQRAATTDLSPPHLQEIIPTPHVHVPHSEPKETVQPAPPESKAAPPV